RGGRTILFVSHNMQAVTRLCTRALLLAGGRIVEDGPSERVVARYLSSELGTKARREWDASDPQAPGNDWVRLRSVRVIDAERATVDSIDVRRSVGVEITFDVRRREVP